MFKIEINPKAFVALTDKQIKAFPKEVAFRLNNAAFQVREGWKAEIPRVFDRPTTSTRNAVVYRKATPDKLYAFVLIKDDVGAGNAPAQYLQAQAYGGARKQKAFERFLQKNPRSRKYFMPGRGIQLDAFGNIPARVIGRILSQLQVRFDANANETAKSRARNQRRQQKKGGGGRYFILPTRRGALRAGTIYERIETGFGSAVRSVLVGTDKTPHYRIRFNPVRITKGIFDLAFAREMDKAVQRISKMR